MSVLFPTSPLKTVFISRWNVALLNIPPLAYCKIENELTVSKGLFLFDLHLLTESF